jgi:hypothetical protein
MGSHVQQRITGEGLQGIKFDCNHKVARVNHIIQLELMIDSMVIATAIVLKCQINKQKHGRFWAIV